ncbi:uncharacterized protein [Nicotiana tomentosiformis]|uniref:uncharacterized protein n=1 Tax=Nicotiana tomentosiformis TaxID=4098 RepID=UPI00388CBFC0
MSATETKGVDLASYRLKGVYYSWFKIWKESREEGNPPARWSKFTDAFMDHFLPAETKTAHAAEFESLKQGSMNVWEYHMELPRMSKYVIHMLSTMEARVCRFLQGLSSLVINEAATTALNSDMNYGKMVAFSQATETRKLKNRMERQSSSKARTAGNFCGSFVGGGGRLAFRGGSSGPSQSFSQSSMSAQSTGSSHGNRGPHQQGHPDGRFQQQRRLPWPKCWRMHFRAYFIDLPICYGCSVWGHIQRDCRSSRRIMGRGVAQPANSIATTSTTPPTRGTSVPAGRGAARGGAHNSGGPSRFYAIQRRRDSEASPDVVTGILTIQSHDVYALIDPGYTFSYVIPYVAMEFGIEPEQLHDLFFVSTPVGESMVVARVYRDCVLTVHGRDTMDDLIKLGMVDFDVIMEMDWLYSCFSKLDCRTRTMRFEFSNESVIE